MAMMAIMVEFFPWPSVGTSLDARRTAFCEAQWPSEGSSLGQEGETSTLTWAQDPETQTQKAIKSPFGEIMLDMCLTTSCLVVLNLSQLFLVAASWFQNSWFHTTAVVALKRKRKRTPQLTMYVGGTQWISEGIGKKTQTSTSSYPKEKACNDTSW